MNPPLFDETPTEAFFEPSKPSPSRRPNHQKGPKWVHPHSRPKHPFESKKRGPQRSRPRSVPKNIAVARSVAADSGVLVLVFLAESSLRALMQSPRIESRGFFLPHEIREGHKFLVSESRRSYEETLKDVPDIETRDLEKIVKKDIEKAVSERFGRTPLVIATVLVA